MSFNGAGAGGQRSCDGAQAPSLTWRKVTPRSARDTRLVNPPANESAMKILLAFDGSVYTKRMPVLLIR